LLTDNFDGVAIRLKVSTLERSLFTVILPYFRETSKLFVNAVSNGRLPAMDMAGSCTRRAVITTLLFVLFMFAGISAFIYFY
jgi:hypothetical protein